MSEDEFSPGTIGFQSCPKVPFLSTIPQVVEFEEYFSKLQLRGDQEDTKTKDAILAESAEKTVIEDIKQYFDDHKNEDAFAFFRQTIPNFKGGFPEKDAIVINLTKGFILCIEAKATLRRNMKRRSDKKKTKDAIEQIQETIDILKSAFDQNLEKEWNIITAVYASKIHDSFKSCEKCDPYIFTKEDFNGKLSKIMENESIKDGSYVQDFYFMVKEVLPLKVQITSKKLTDSFSMNKSLLETVTDNVSAAGTAENVAYWSDNQYNIASRCLEFKRVILSSAWSTGKTATLLHCAQELLNIGEKVLIIIDHRYDPFNEKLETLLQLKLQMLFEHDDKIKIISKNVSDHPEDACDQIFPQYDGYNIFIDELTYGGDCKRYVEWNKRIGENKHFWLVCSIPEDASITELNKLYGTNWLAPNFQHSLRNAKEITGLVLSMKNAGSYDPIEMRGCDFLPSLMKLKQPSNLTNTLPVEFIKSKNYADGFEMALKSLSRFSDTETEHAMFVCNWGYTECKTCKCYVGDEPTNSEFVVHISEIFDQSGRSRPIVYR